MARLSQLFFCLALAAKAFASSNSSSNFATLAIEAPDGSAKAHFIRRGATTTNFWVKDKHGKFRDIILGFDNHTEYASDDLGHPYFGPVVGRNGTFTVPISKDASGNGTKYHVPENDNNGTDTLHGGLVGFDRRNWTVAAHTKNSITFTYLDPNGTEGFPGNVHATVKYTLEDKSTWDISIKATADEKTPILLSCHQYWNFEAYQETQDLSGHYAEFASSKIIATNGLLIPNGSFVEVEGTPLDFRKAKSIGKAINETTTDGYCGTGCIGFDNCFVYDDNKDDKPIFSMWSVNSGIKLEVTTNQQALQMYTCDGIYNATNPIPRKKDQGGPDYHYTDHSCVVLEQESYIDAINNPEYGINQIYGPGRDYNWESKYVFSVVK
ncbi:galactose mutarotase-like protein [Athelia psychrophila]|uniref:Galactose mutarotase-like protein n=1 Tax=Athelia psychrophila TaxID=1759441 RepID=A0A166FZ04_9AGAM|nr:galactose mutarotase-like protein [Fibularhizoctonia sp. CBS 109695]